MQEVVKNLVYSSIGMFAINVKRIQEQMDKMAETQKEQQVEGEKIVTDFFKNSNEKGKELGEKVGGFFKSFMTVKNEKVEELSSRVSAIESSKN